MTFSVRPFEEIVEFLTSAPKPEDILAFKPSRGTKAKLNQLLKKNTDGQLSEIEQKELDQFLLLEHLMRLAKGRGKQKVAA